MSDGPRIPHHAGLRLAERVFALLGGCYERAAVAGSLRRGADYVGDLDLLLRPTEIDGLNLLDARISDLLRDGTFTLAQRTDGAIKSNGPRRKCVLFEGLTVELRLILPDRHWGPAAVIYTGPYEANRVLVTTTGTKTSEGQRGILPRGLAFRDGGLWEGDQLLTTPEEEHVFKACGLPYIPPHERTAERYQDMATGERYQYREALARWPVLIDAVHGVDGRPVDVRLPEPVPSGGRVVQGSLF